MDEIFEENLDIQLDFHSVSAKQGHFGSSTTYIAAEHRVERRTWGARKRFWGLLPPKQVPPTVEYLEIPENITTEEEIVDYVEKHRGHWIRHRRQRR